MTLSADHELIAARTRVAAASRELAAAGLVLGTAGNVSERVGDRVAITPTGARLTELTPAHVTVVALDGSVLDGALAPTSEAALHLGVYARHDARAVVHTHAPLATALACVLDELPCVHYQMLQLGGPVPVVPYFTFGSPELAEATVAGLEGRQAVLMANHGAVTTGHDLAAAVENARLLEWACAVYWRAASLGTPRVLGEAELAAVVETVVRRGYGTMRPADDAIGAPAGTSRRS
ncbi:MAG TPA: class II aldolase/adducin family protein [Solirubrobacteraceae bacterium]|nr:class II aldolase/adducin family protein [Solirubrobacteraceae bacterium]